MKAVNLAMTAQKAEPSMTVPAMKRRGNAWDYVLAVLVVAIALLIREALDPLVGKKLPFACFLLATTYIAWTGNSGAALLTLVLGFGTADLFVLEPRGSFVIKDEANFISIISYFCIGSSIIFATRSLHLARQRANDNADEAKRAAEEVRRLNAELEQRVADRTAELVAANAELEAFTYSVSHDLRAPLRHVDGYAQILEEEFGAQLPQEVLAYTSKIRRGSRNMGRLVDDLLDFSRVGKKEINCQKVPLKNIVNDVIADMHMELENRRIEWVIGELPVIDGDSALIKQVFVNLISNAVKYSRPRELAKIEIGTTQIQGEKVVFIRDNGVGFNMKYAGKLFGVFQRLHRSEEFEGTGVGLATVARIVHRHGGRIWAEAEIDKGASFFLTFPALSKV